MGLLAGEEDNSNCIRNRKYIRSNIALYRVLKV